MPLFTEQKIADPQNIWSARADIFKHTATISGVLASIYGTFLLTSLKEQSIAVLFLVLGIILLLILSGWSVFALANVAFFIRGDGPKPPEEVQRSLKLNYGLFLGGIFFVILFTVFHACSLPNQKAVQPEEKVKRYIEGYVDKSVKALQEDMDMKIAQELKTLQRDMKVERAQELQKVTKDFEKALSDLDRKMQQAILKSQLKP